MPKRLIDKLVCFSGSQRQFITKDFQNLKVLSQNQPYIVKL
jgi:hypothetical protein